MQKALHRTLVAAIVLFGGIPAFGQQKEEFDYQARILAHTQLVPPDATFGFAGWAIVPDITKQKPRHLGEIVYQRPFRVLLVGGVVYKKPMYWIEVMAGAAIDSHHNTGSRVHGDPIANMRQHRNGKKLNFFGEVQFAFRAKRLLVGSSLTTPVQNGRLRLHIGGESDVFVMPSRNSVAAGPRVVIPLPICKKICKNASLATAYQFRKGSGDIVRSYFLLNF